MIVNKNGVFIDTHVRYRTISDNLSKQEYKFLLTTTLTISEKKIQQYENREKILRQKLSREERRERNHRLIVRGAVFESIVPEAKNMTDEEAAALLRLALTSEPVREFLRKRAEETTS